MTIYTCMHLEVKSWCKSWNQWMNSGLFCQISIHSGHIHISISQHSPPVHCSVFMSFCECLCVLEVHLGHLFYFLSSSKTILIEMFLEYSKSGDPYEARKFFWPTFLFSLSDGDIRTKGTFVVLMLGYVFARCYVSTDIHVCASGFLHQLHFITSLKE